MNLSDPSKKIKVLLLGASFETGNLGVSALAESSLKCILQRWPGAEVNFFFSGRSTYTESITIGDRTLRLINVPVRFSKNILLKSHFIKYVLFITLRKILPVPYLIKLFLNNNPFVKELYETDIVTDITGGDSFSDIYGMKRFITGFLTKWLVLLYNKPLILLPQTYGPYTKYISRLLAKYILKKARLIFSRDRDGINYIHEIFSSKNTPVNLSLVPDVAFILDPKAPGEIKQLNRFIEDKKNHVVVGLNINALVYYGGYTMDNMFYLKVDYKNLIHEILEYFLSRKNIKVLLVPHVFTNATGSLIVEDDLSVCSEIYDEFSGKYPDSIFVSKQKYNHNEIKYIIGMTDFFLGTRMHSCIAAISQCIPTVGLAYSKKFRGVFDTAGVGDHVLDMRSETDQEILKKISSLFKRRNETSEHLRDVIPHMKENVINLFSDL
ncbi:MAG: polysaccharide pyruvyl transferase family protein [Smithella sp.]|nr:polysaccharide pyruvyl transferase family protein [Smithella sp.]